MGFAATSTREIAEKAEIQQATLYYHFKSKSTILAGVVARTVRPTTERLAELRAMAEGGPAQRALALYLLVAVDVHTVAPHPASLVRAYRQPDVRNVEEVKDWLEEHEDLTAAYRELAAGVLNAFPGTLDPPSEDLAAPMILQLVENAGDEASEEQPAKPRDVDAQAATIGTSALRVMGVPEPTIAKVAEKAAAVLPRLLAKEQTQER